MTTSAFILVCIVGVGLASAFFTVVDLIRDARLWLRLRLAPRGFTSLDRNDLTTQPMLQVLCARSFASLVDNTMIDA